MKLQLERSAFTSPMGGVRLFKSASMALKTGSVSLQFFSHQFASTVLHNQNSRQTPHAPNQNAKHESVATEPVATTLQIKTTTRATGPLPVTATVKIALIISVMVDKLPWFNFSSVKSGRGSQ